MRLLLLRILNSAISSLLEDLRFSFLANGLGDRESHGKFRMVLLIVRILLDLPGCSRPDIILHRCQANVLQQCQWNIESNSIVVHVVYGLVAQRVYIPWLPWSCCFKQSSFRHLLFCSYLQLSFFLKPQKLPFTMSSHNSEHINDKPTLGHNELSRQMTLQLSPDQYERLFFQPSAPKGDLAKRLGTSLLSPPSTISHPSNFPPQQETLHLSASLAFLSPSPPPYFASSNSRAATHPPLLGSPEPSTSLAASPWSSPESQNSSSGTHSLWPYS
jgi:hypothetical protein